MDQDGLKMRLIKDIYKDNDKKRNIFSFEFFPPKNAEGEAKLFATIEELKSLAPDFISVTYGAGGSTRSKTKEWVTAIQDRYQITAMAHFTCVGSGREESYQIVKELYDSGVQNIMALRGDPPKGEVAFKPSVDGFRYAGELISFLKEKLPNLSYGGGCYPEKHPEAISLDQDLLHLKMKQDKGSDFFITQLFFDNKVFKSFMDKCRAKGINKPIIPGIMPITQYSQIERFTQMAGCSFPRELVSGIEQYKDDKEKLISFSIDFTVSQCRELLRDLGAPGIHFYTLNQSMATREILKKLK